MNQSEAVYKVLSDAKVPLSVPEITRRIFEQSLCVTGGKTPDRSISAVLSKDVKHNGENSRYVRVKPGVYSLRTNDGGSPISQPQLPIKEQPEAQTQGASDAVNTVSFTDAAEIVLNKFAGHQPMHYQDITNKALELDLISTSGLRPAATMYAQVLTETDRKKKRGELPRFVMHGKGMVGLYSWEDQGLKGQIEAHNREVRKKLLQQLHSMDPKEFENLIAILLSKMGFEEVTVTQYHNDGGIDVMATLVISGAIQTHMAVQVKRWTGNVGVGVVTSLRGSLTTHQRGLIITTSDFAKRATQEANAAGKTPIALINGPQLVNLLIENNIGVSRTPLDLIELAEIITSTA